MIVTVFRLDLTTDPEILKEYLEWAARMNELVQTIPGYISHKRFLADDGERCTIVEFENEESQKIWANHPIHIEAKALGRSKFFDSYDIKICEVTKILKS